MGLACVELQRAGGQASKCGREDGRLIETVMEIEQGAG